MFGLILELHTQHTFLKAVRKLKVAIANTHWSIPFLSAYLLTSMFSNVMAMLLAFGLDWVQSNSVKVKYFVWVFPESKHGKQELTNYVISLSLHCLYSFHFEMFGASAGNADYNSMPNDGMKGEALISLQVMTGEVLMLCLFFLV